MAKIIVFNNRAGKIDLPATYKDKKERITFLPGKNEIEKDLWEEIVKQNQNGFDNYYSGTLKPFFPCDDKGQPIPVDSERPIQISALKIDDARALIDNTADFDELVRYLDDEKTRSKPRKPIVDEINHRIEEHREYLSRRTEGTRK